MFIYNKSSTMMNSDKKVLVVDDSQVIRNIVVSELQAAGYQVFEATDGEDALDKLSRIKKIDLMTLDVEMPTMDGFKVLEKIRSPYMEPILRKVENTNVPVVFVTSKDTWDDRYKGYNLGATDFIGKPFVEGEILHAVDRILNPSEVFKKLRVLVAEDENVVRRIIVFCLMQLGVTVYEADDGETAFEILKSSVKGIDLIITDLYMKKINGDEFCRKVREELNLKEIPIIFLSANTNSHVTFDLFKAGASDVLQKPFIREEIMVRFSNHLERLKMAKLLKNRSNNELACLECDYLDNCEKAKANQVLVE